MKIALLSILMIAPILWHNPSKAQIRPDQEAVASSQLLTGADQTTRYLPYLKGKRIGMVVNPSSLIAGKTSVDSLNTLGVNIVKIFGPEHGFRGNASNGAHVDDSTDPKTGIPVVSLYGKSGKPAAKDLTEIDLMIYDLQDVGARYYTYLATLHRVMEACGENNKELLILDRPNPNGYMVDGPVLDMKLKSGIGFHPVPIAHGMTVAEYAQMINGQGWMAGGIKCKLKIIPMTGYDHEMPYSPPVYPSPNLNTQQSILLYPSICLFEGTIISQGRGTDYPFTVLGNPDLNGKYTFAFTPRSIPGMSESPLFINQECYGLDLRNYDTKKLIRSKRINLSWLLDLYKAYPYKERFFDFRQSKQMGNFDKLAGTTALKEQIIAGKTEKEIRASWEPGLSEFKKMRKQYLLYP
ncbi:DUF1343 domain-containing protein [Pedobacter psychrodurus]|uniref:DUF1343 domain-containing protein n=1 Tax=Pedobacter psychrodurus TaxID=2530456 RepID=A0A4R0PZE6_9SPHI|nr:DUF1343 domain-containing protein [Pedobacter psychrodurus]TCD28611.1 DUF1343 domain-containing protein [Pedobacter psychrodurus]